MSKEIGNLILTGVESDAFYIGDDIVVTVVWIRRNEVRIAFAVPKEIEIVRSRVTVVTLEQDATNAPRQ